MEVWQFRCPLFSPSTSKVQQSAVYQGFDILARRQLVFKVESIADSYVAATGESSKK